MKDGKLAVKTVAAIPNVDQTFGGTFSPIDAGSGAQRPRAARRGACRGSARPTPVKVVGG